MDCNPVMVGEKSAVAVDPRVRGSGLHSLAGALVPPPLAPHRVSRSTLNGGYPRVEDDVEKEDVRWLIGRISGRAPDVGSTSRPVRARGHARWGECPYLPEELDVYCDTCRFNFFTGEGNPSCDDPSSCEHATEPLGSTWRTFVPGWHADRKKKKKKKKKNDASPRRSHASPPQNVLQRTPAVRPLTAHRLGADHVRKEKEAVRWTKTNETLSLVLCSGTDDRLTGSAVFVVWAAAMERPVESRPSSGR